MKKIVIAIAIAVGAGVIAGTPAQAINCHAFNQGTGNAAHNRGVDSPGIMRIAYACHGFGG